MLSRTPSRVSTDNRAPEDASLVAAARAYDHQKYELAERTWRVLAVGGDAEAQFRLAESYLSGPRAEELSAEAISWFTRAAEQGHPFAQNELGLIYRFGQGVPADPVEAAKWTERAAVQGVAEAQVNLGTVYARGEGVAQDNNKAREWYARGAVAPVGDSNSWAGSPDAVPGQHHLDRPWGKNAIDPKRVPAAPEPGFAARLAETGSLREFAEAGGARDDATDLLSNRDQPLDTFSEINRDERTRHVDAARDGALNEDRRPYVRAEQTESSDSFQSEWDRGRSLTPSHAEAGAPDEYLEAAFREENDPGTQGDLAGDDVPDSFGGPVSRYLAGEVAYRERRFDASLRIWEPLASEGMASAQLALGNLYESGQGVAQNLEVAAHWYGKAAEQGLPEAHYALGLCYLFGRGVPEDPTAALSQLQRAADMGSGYAKSVFPELEKELAPVEPSSATTRPSGASRVDLAQQPMPHATIYNPETASQRGSGITGLQGRRSSHRRRRGSRRRTYWRIGLATVAILFLLAAGTATYVAGPGTRFY